MSLWGRLRILMFGSTEFASPTAFVQERIGLTKNIWFSEADADSKTSTTVKDGPQAVRYDLQQKNQTELPC